MPAIKPIHYKKLVKIFEIAGWKYDRTNRPVVIPAYKTVPVFVIKNNLRTANITNEEYWEILIKV